MLFNSYTFLLAFLPAAIVLCRLADPYPRLRIPTMVLLSLIFYGWWDPRFVPLLAALIVVNWMAARSFAGSRAGTIITAAIVTDLAVLGLFKYFNFFADNIEWLIAAPVGHLQLALPLGISFFTFHHIMYLVDLRRGRAKPAELERFALYICFFPQAIAGPLARWSEVGHQFGRQVFAPGWEQRWGLGVTLVIIGLIEKVMLGDPIGQRLDPIYAQAEAGPIADGTAWFALGFGFQILFDFAGYSDIALGLGLLFGIELPVNFNAPFRATTILEFWQRWHMTLSRFLRDYVFLPLVDKRIAGKRHTVAHYVGGVLVTMGLCGLWHSAAWRFVLWGTLHGLAIIFVLGWRRFLPRAPTLQAAWQILAGLAVVPDPGTVPRYAVLAAAAVAAVALPSGRDLADRFCARPRPLIAGMLALAGVAVMVRLGGDQSYEFIYFRF